MLKMLFKEELWQDLMNRSSKIKIYSYFIEMSQTRLPQQRNPLEDIQDLKGQPDLTIKPIPEDFDNEVLPEIEEKITAEDVFGLQENVKLDETVDKLDGIVEDKMTDNLPVPKRKIGKRGKDKVPRKRRRPFIRRCITKTKITCRSLARCFIRNINSSRYRTTFTTFNL